MNKQKLLGQFYSGDKIAKVLFDLLGRPTNNTVIDPMCGEGDLLKPFCQSNHIFGVELDKEAYDAAVKNLSQNSSITHKNAFSKELLDSLRLEGYHIVITNPPYIRRENYRIAVDTIEGTIPMTIVKENLSAFCDKTQTVTLKQKELIKEALFELSGLSDIASFSWILCMLSVMPNGMLAIVVPNTWIGREYSAPVVKLLDELFEIQFVINDVNSVWFKGSAQIQTSLIVAKRTDKVSLSHKMFHVDLYKTAVNNDSITSFLTTDQSFVSFIKANNSIKKCCEIKEVFQKDYFLGDRLLLPTSRLLSLPIDEKSLVSLADFGISCGQGFRSGANTFFILKREGNYYVSNIGGIKIKKDTNFFVPIIQKQVDLPDAITINAEGNLSVLLNIPKEYASNKDKGMLPKDVSCSFRTLPFDLDNYIQIASNTVVGGNTIPNLSAVRTNVRTKGGIRFWYHLPPFSKRQFCKVFFPRVNGMQVVGRYNPQQFIVDANFLSIWSNTTDLTEEGVLAITNSTWFKIQCEEGGIVLGGGALKIDSIQIKKFVLPSFSKTHLKKLNALGAELTKISIHETQKVAKRIDFVFLSELGIKKDQSYWQKKMLDILNDYIDRRR